MAPEISRPGAPASAKFMAWAILNGKSLAWTNEKYEKSSSGRDFHPKNLPAWTIFNGKFLAWSNEKIREILFWARFSSKMAPEISRPGAPASAKFMAWAILNGKSLAWANEKYVKSSSVRDFHLKNLPAWTIFNGKFLAWSNEKYEKSSSGLDFLRKWLQRSPVQLPPPRQNSWPGPF